MNKIQSIIRTLLGKKKVSPREDIIILLVINVIVGIILSIAGCTPTIDSQIKKFRDRQTLIFYKITDGNDTCLVLNFLDCAYDELSIKVVDWQTFDSYFLRKVLHNEIIEVSEEYLQKERLYSIKPVESINELYENYGLDSLLNYLEVYPLNQLHKDDKASFDWAAYLLWKNDIYVSLSEEVNYWYIDYSYQSIHQ